MFGRLDYGLCKRQPSIQEITCLDIYFASLYKNDKSCASIILGQIRVPCCAVHTGMVICYSIYRKTKSSSSRLSSSSKNPKTITPWHHPRPRSPRHRQPNSPQHLDDDETKSMNELRFPSLTAVPNSVRVRLPAEQMLRVTHQRIDRGIGVGSCLYKILYEKWADQRSPDTKQEVRGGQTPTQHQ